MNEMKSKIDLLCSSNTSCPFDLSKPIPLYIMTDDASELNETKFFNEFEFLYLNVSRHNTHKADYMFTSEQMKNRTEIFLTLATELELISNAKAYVGTNGSNLSHLLVKMFYHRKGTEITNLHTLLTGSEGWDHV